jgi:hypothetical protein
MSDHEAVAVKVAVLSAFRLNGTIPEVVIQTYPTEFGPRTNSFLNFLPTR